METASIYDKQSGRISVTVVAPDKEAVMLQVSDTSRQAVFFGEELNGREIYMRADEPTPRPTMSISVSVDGAPVEFDTDINLATGSVMRVSGIPKGSVLTHPQGELIVDDGYVEWSGVVEGGYYFRVANFPYKEVEFHAVIG